MPRATFRIPRLGSAALGLVTLGVPACGGSSDSGPFSPSTTGGSAGSVATAGGPSIGGSAGMPGGESGRAGSGNATGGSAGEPPTKGVDCDLRKITCKRAQPLCEPMTVPAVEGTCYGECVAIGDCACTEAEDCPFSDSYTCWRSAMRCGPYVN